MSLARPAPAAHPAARAYLHPGELLASAAPCEATTILGSCVAACIFDPGAGIGGLTHHLLPHGAAEAGRPGRFANLAVPELVRRLVALGARPAALRAKLFGGACVLQAFASVDRHLGAQNVAAAREALDALSVRVIAEDVGGRSGRRLVFHTADGAAGVRTL
jgi:chemotaxis protein CheD